MKYYIADLHLGHENIIRLSKRPFKTVQEMDDVIIDNINSVVTDDDDLYILGDVCFKCNNPMDYINRINGRKHLVIGNHDKFLIKNPSIRKCFVEIKDIMTVTDGDYRIVLCHYPMVEWDGYYRGVLHFYGHIHNNFDNDTTKYITSVKNAYNVGVDILGFMPKTAKQIVA